MKYRIEWCEKKKTSTNKEYFKATITDEQGKEEEVSIWSDFPQFIQIQPGLEVEGYIKVNGNYKNLSAISTSPRKPNMERVMEKKATFIAESQNRKEQSIAAAQDRSAWMWAKNNAVELVNSKMYPVGDNGVLATINELATEIYLMEPVKPF